MRLSWGLAVLFLGANVLTAFGRPDLPSRREREAVVERAEQLAEPPTVESVDDLPNPFDPNRLAEAETEVPKAAQPVESPPPSVREILEVLAARIPATGSMTFGGQAMLTISIPPYRLTVGDPVVVTDQGKEYLLEIVSIADTTFRVRYRDEEVTRAIRLGR